MDETFRKGKQWSERRTYLVDLQVLLHLVSLRHVVGHPLHVQPLVGLVGRKALLVGLVLPVQVGLVVAGEAEQAVPAALVGDHGGGDGLRGGVGWCRLLRPGRRHRRPGDRRGGGGLAGLILLRLLWAAEGKV